MIGIVIFLAAVLAFILSLIDGSEVGATVSLVIGGVVLSALILAGYARLGAWLWGL